MLTRLLRLLRVIPGEKPYIGNLSNDQIDALGRDDG